MAKEWIVQMIYFLQQSRLKKVSVQKSNITWNESASIALYSYFAGSNRSHIQIFFLNDTSLGVTQIIFPLKTC